MSITDVSVALRTRLEAAALGFPVAIENVEFDSANVALYLVPFVIPVTSESLMKEAAGQFEQRGIYQVSVFAKTNIGWATAIAAADAIRSAFPYNGKYVQNGVTVGTLTTNQNGGRNADGRFIVDVTIDWYSYINR